MDLELRPNETIEKEFASDYWTTFGPITVSQKRGKYIITNERIYFRGGFITEVEIPFSEIDYIKKCNVGGLIPFMPTGIKVMMKNGEKHILSVLGRGKIMEMIEEKIK